VPTLFKEIITINSVSFNDDANLPATASFFGCDVLDGWSGTSEIDAIVTQIGASDGAILGDFFPARARNLTMAGAVETDNMAERQALEEYVKGVVFPRNQELILTKYEAVPKFIRVRVSGAREIAPNPTKTGFRFSIPLVAPDPLKYSLTPSEGTAGVAGVSTGGFTFPLTFPLIFNTVDTSNENSVTIINDGTGNSSPLVTLFGPLNKGWFLQNLTTGDVLRFDIGLNTGDEMLIDFRQEIALLNNSVVTSTLVGDFWKVVPGTNKIRLFANFDPLAGFRIVSYPAWE